MKKIEKDQVLTVELLASKINEIIEIINDRESPYSQINYTKAWMGIKGLELSGVVEKEVIKIIDDALIK